MALIDDLLNKLNVPKDEKEKDKTPPAEGTEPPKELEKKADEATTITGAFDSYSSDFVELVKAKQHSVTNL